MNREIKFRAVHTLTKHWFYEEHIVYHNDEWYEDWRAFENGRELNLDQVAVMQYTGLKDKNGTEIYEGDIIENDSDDAHEVVTFDEGSFWLEGSTYTTPLYEVNTGAEEIIGNIYENPELLERDEE